MSCGRGRSFGGISLAVAVLTAGCGLDRDGTAGGADASSDATTTPDATLPTDAQTDAVGSVEAGGDAPAKPTAAFLALGIKHTCAILTDGRTVCWGNNDNGETGMGTVSDGGVDPPLAPAPSPVGVAAALMVGGGGLFSGASPPSAYSFSCALVPAGKVACWGNDALGQLGRGADAGSPTPIPLPMAQPTTLMAGVLELAVGGAHACARTASDVRCWGYNVYGELGRPPGFGSDPTPSPVTPPPNAPVVQLATGGFHSCLLESGGAIECFGLNNVGQLARSTGSFDPAHGLVGSVTGATQITAGWAHNCALLADAGVTCWGYNGQGELGRGTATASEAPGAVTLPPDVTAVQVSAGGLHTCMVVSDGGVWCWGYNTQGQLGVGTVANGVVSPATSVVPMQVARLPRAKQVVCGGTHTCVILESGDVRCWGDDTYGQLGRGTSDTTPHPEAAPVMF